LELDTIVAEALKIQGCAGARMTGAGFGGCAIALAEQSAIQSFTSTVSENYKKIIGYAPSLYVQESG
jgi:galactokinase